MKFFHASRNVYSPGDTIYVPPGAESFAYGRSLELGMRWREEALERARGDRGFPRRTAVYAANTAVNAARFLISQAGDGGQVWVYEVAISATTPSPMALIGYMDAHGAGFSSLDACVEEYWAPTKQWNFLEFVCESMTVQANSGVVAEEDLWMAIVDYEHDRQLARRLWGPPPPLFP
jgi:hypothetical protein